MRKLCCFLFSFCFVLAAGAQKVYFLYFQTDNAAPFYVKMGDRILSATSSGYLILPGLTDSTYTVAIGFPSILVESRFRIAVTGDRGFLIKGPGPSPALSDLQSNDQLNPIIDEAEKNVTYQERTDDFTTLLSKAAGDPNLVYVAIRQPPKEAPVIVQDTPTKKDTVAVVVNMPPPAEVVAVVKKDSSETVSTPPPRDTVVQSPPATNISPAKPVDSSLLVVQPTEEPYKHSIVKKHAESSTGEGFGLVYYDYTSTGNDTIRLLIPNPRIVLKQQADTAASDGQLLYIKKEELPVQVKDTMAQAPVSGIPASCKALATQSDFFKLRKSMAAKISDEAMVDEAKKYFRSKCFSTEQARNLSALFLNSAGKYLFFDAAYGHVSDPDQFSSLSTELKDDYYLKRFKALVGQ
jgi:hypothetical protein